jgi:hypothetical protein
LYQISPSAVIESENPIGEEITEPELKTPFPSNSPKCSWKISPFPTPVRKRGEGGGGGGGKNQTICVNILQKMSDDLHIVRMNPPIASLKKAIKPRQKM